MAVKNVVQAIPLTSFDTASLTTSFQVLNSTGLTAACFLIRLVNNSDKDITISYNGTDAAEFIRKGSDLPLNAQTNSQPNNKVALFPLGQKIYVKGASSGTGLIYLSGYFQPQTN